jgi:probable F420-dependent oxidoreductase
MVWSIYVARLMDRCCATPRVASSTSTLPVGYIYGESFEKRNAMKFGIAFANTGPFVQPAAALQFALAAEAAGFESLWTVEHVVVPANYQSPYPYSEDGRMPGSESSPIPDPLVWLAYLAAATTTLRLATGILIAAQRQPVVLAKEVATLDFLSGGRVDLGVGVGWLREEFDAIGVPFEERGRRLDDAILSMRELWSAPQATFQGEFTQFTNCISQPAPVNGTVPIHIGGHTEIAARRAGRLGDGFFPASGSHDELRHLFNLVHATAESAGRDANVIEFTTGGNGAVGGRALDEVAELAAIGVDRVMLPALLFYRDPEGSLARYGDDVIKKL